MLINAHQTYYQKLKPYCKGKLLMLGNHGSEIGPGQAVFECEEYRTLDLDGGDYNVDLTKNTEKLDLQWDTVFNLGTIEHIWDIHSAYCNAARMVKVGGYFINVAPVGVDFIDHGIHLTSADALMLFFTLNGFDMLEYWTSDNVNLWFVAKKKFHITRFTCPQQVWTNGYKPVKIG